VRKLLRNRKAVSSVLSTILMIMIVVVGMSVAFGYFVNFVKDYQAGRGQSVMEMISIEDVWFRAGNTSIWVYNYGKVSVTINALYIDGQSVNFDPLSSLSVPVGEHGDMIVPSTAWNLTSAPGTTHLYHFKLVTERGSAFEGEYVSPDS
jgi:flagellin-like protein